MLLISSFVSACIVFLVMAAFFWAWTKAFDFMTSHRLGDFFFFGTVLAILTSMFYAGAK